MVKWRRCRLCGIEGTCKGEPRMETSYDQMRKIAEKLSL
jgi:hypothetical protein